MVDQVRAAVEHVGGRLGWFVSERQKNNGKFCENPGDLVCSWTCQDNGPIPDTPGQDMCPFNFGHIMKGKNRCLIS